MKYEVTMFASLTVVVDAPSAEDAKVEARSNTSYGDLLSDGMQCVPVALREEEHNEFPA